MGSGAEKLLLCFNIMMCLIQPQLLSSLLPISYSATVRYLPGFQGPLPFEMETGYVGVGESEDVQLFYYFVKSSSSSKNPEKDPLLLWLTGGPGCSGLSGLIYEIGPLNFMVEEYNGCLPNLLWNPHSWTQVASIIFVDSPVGTGFSYSRSSQGYKTGDFKSSQHLYQFLTKWMIDHPDFLENPFYVAGDSYSGNEAGSELFINIKCISGLNQAHILEPFCTFASPIPKEVVGDLRQSYSDQFLHDPQPPIPEVGCRTYAYYLAQFWANDYSVRNALHIHKGSIGKWQRCHHSLPYSYEIQNNIQYHLYLSKKVYRSLIYSGDHDMIVPFLGTEAWIKSLNYSITDEWRSWTVNGQRDGYTRTYCNHMPFTTVKGGGHTALAYKPKECFAMLKRWISEEPL